MTETERQELINLARMYERVHSERRQHFLAYLKAKREMREDDAKACRAAFEDARRRASCASSALADHIAWPCETIKVDGVIYVKTGKSNLLRMPPDIPEMTTARLEDLEF